MKRKATYLCLALLIVSGADLFAQTVSIPDSNFRNFLKTYFGSVLSPTGELITAKAATIKGTFFCGNQNIRSLEGIQYFTGIDTLLCYGNKLTTLPDLSAMTKLTVVDCFQNQITTLPSFKGLVNLQSFNASDNKISSFPLFDSLTGIRGISFYHNNLTSIPDLTQLSKLENLVCSDNQITQIGKLPSSLQELHCGGNKLTEVPDISLAKGIKALTIYSNQIVSLPDLSPYTSLTVLNLGTNKIISVPQSLSTLTTLTILALDNNKLRDLPDLSKLAQLTSSTLNNNYFSFEDLLPSSANPHFGSWVVAPQDSFPVPQLSKGREYEKYVININTDDKVQGLIFSWFQNGTSKAVTSKPILEFDPLMKSDEGSYYCKITSSEPLFAGLALVSESFAVSIQSSPDFKFEVELTLTPNGDGKNDELLIKDNGILKVYDSSGFLLDQRPSPCYWNGSTSSGKELGTGFYVLRINDEVTYGLTIIR